MKSTKTVSTHLWQHIVSDNKAGFLLSDCFLLTRSSLQTGSEWQGGTELPQSTGSHGSKQTGMANTSTNTTASLHWNVATPAQKLARARKQWIHNEQTDEVNDTSKTMLQSEMIHMSKTLRQRGDVRVCEEQAAGEIALSNVAGRMLKNIHAPQLFNLN